jgi:hypothetical protein
MKGDIIWQSIIREDMVAHLNEQEISMLIETLDETVAEIGENYGLE